MYVIFGKCEVDDLSRIIEGSRNGEFKCFQESKENFLDHIKINHKSIEAVGYYDVSIPELDILTKKIADIYPDLTQIAMLEEVPDSFSKNIDVVLEKKECLLKLFIRKLEEKNFKKRSLELKNIISSCEGELSIFLHDNPDLDAISSAVALESICMSENVNYGTYFAGSIGHPETEIFLENSDFMIKKVDEESIHDTLDSADKVAFVDFADASTSEVIPDDIEPDIIIDHHYTNREKKGKEFTEIKSHLGATATIMTEHLLNLELDIEPTLASALLLGIKIDTNNYTKNISTSDFKAISFLNAVADKDILDVLEQTPIKSETVTIIGKAISNRKFKNNVLVTYCGEIEHSDDISQIADFLLRERDILTVLVYGKKNDRIHISGRSKDLELNLGDIMKKAFSDLGEAGGHPHSAGGEIPMKQKDEDDLVELIRKKFFEEVVI